MSAIVGFRNRVMDLIRDNVTKISEVNWYDGIFDEDDIKEWSHKVPAAYVSIMTSDTRHHSTGEMNADLRCIVVVIDHDSYEPRNADENIWTICEDLSTFINLNRFGDPNAGDATKIKFQRLVHPELRREGVAVGIVEWETILTIGNPSAVLREFVYKDGVQVQPTPRDLFLGVTNHTGQRETIDMSYPDEASPVDEE